MEDFLVEDFYRLVVEDIALIDVRAPVEFAAGGAPGAVNLPLLQDDQRHLVGLCYRRQGKDAALDLGHALVSVDIRERLVAGWTAFLAEHPDAHVYCARGGMRSAIVCRWIAEAGVRRPPRLAGGYKALRNYLLSRLEPEMLPATPVVLGGRTGSGKTRMLALLENAVDLEALAQHRGSSFGGYIAEQPGQADFENRLAAAFVRHRQKGFAHIVVEDEGRHVGKRFLPKALAAAFAASALVILEVARSTRVDAIVAEYVTAGQAQYLEKYGEETGLQRWASAIDDSMVRLAKRLGGQRLADVRALLQEAYRHQVSTGDGRRHCDWVEQLLIHYYDPMYDYQISRKRDRIAFRGGWDAVLSYLQGIRD